MSVASTSSTSTAGLSPFCASRGGEFGAATTATSPPASAPAITTAPIETYQRICCPPVVRQDRDTQIVRRKARRSLALHIQVKSSRKSEVASQRLFALPRF